MKTWLCIASIVAASAFTSSAETPAAPRVAVGFPSLISVVNLTGVELTNVHLRAELVSLDAKTLASGAAAAKTSQVRGNCGMVLSFDEGGVKHQLGEALVLDERTAHEVRVEIRPGFVLQVHTSPEPIFSKTTGWHIDKAPNGFGVRR